MKRITKALLLCLMSTLLLFGCGGGAKDKNIEAFKDKLFSEDTYKNITDIKTVKSPEEMEKFSNEVKNTFSGYFTEKGFEEIVSNRLINLYITILRDAKDIDDVELKVINENKQDTYTIYECEITYNLEFNEETLAMKDKVYFKVLNEKPYLIDMFELQGTSSILDVYGKLMAS